MSNSDSVPARRQKASKLHRYQWGDETIETTLSEADAFALSHTPDPAPHTWTCPPVAYVDPNLLSFKHSASPTRIIIEKRNVKSRIPTLPFAPENIVLNLDETIKLSKLSDGYRLYIYGSDCEWHEERIEPLRAEIITYYFNKRAFPDARTCSVTLLAKDLSESKSIKSTMNAITEVRSICKRVGCMEILRRYSKGIYGLNKELDCCATVWK